MMVQWVSTLEYTVKLEKKKVLYYIVQSCTLTLYVYSVCILCMWYMYVCRSIHSSEAEV